MTHAVEIEVVILLRCRKATLMTFPVDKIKDCESETSRIFRDAEEDILQLILEKLAIDKELAKKAPRSTEGF